MFPFCYLLLSSIPMSGLLPDCSTWPEFPTGFLFVWVSPSLPANLSKNCILICPLPFTNWGFMIDCSPWGRITQTMSLLNFSLSLSCIGDSNVANPPSVLVRESSIVCMEPGWAAAHVGRQSRTRTGSHDQQQQPATTPNSFVLTPRFSTWSHSHWLPCISQNSGSGES